MDTEVKNVGTVVFDTDTLLITDPCYDTPNVWCQGKVHNIKPGNWVVRTLSVLDPPKRYSEEYLASLSPEVAESLRHADAGLMDHFEKHPDDWRRVAAIVVMHESATENPDDFSKWDQARFEVGVDSGQVGVFAANKYPTDPNEFEYDDNSFYGRCCSATNPTGIVAEGVVTNTMFGDGTYSCYTVSLDGKVVGVAIDFSECVESEDNFDDDEYENNEFDDENDTKYV